jgi:alkylation response protein AidB-like acyl-CoA dehydrogenase
MTFDFSGPQAEARDRARAYAVALAADAAAIDRAASIPGEVARAAAALIDEDLLSMVVAIEEIAAVSAAVATLTMSTAADAPLGLTGLRGAKAVEPSARTRLALAAVALGIGKAATEVALAELRRARTGAEADVEKPHWVVADVATDLDAARLLTYKAARSGGEADGALARVLASAAAARAVDAAVRVVGPHALTEGSLLDRLSRDVRVVAVLAGTEEEQRAIAADGVLPQA